MENLYWHGSSPLGQTKLAREAGLANNTVAAGYLEMLADLLSVGILLPWDASCRPGSPNEYIEVKRGPVSPINLAWFARAFPTARPFRPIASPRAAAPHRPCPPAAKRAGEGPV